MKSTTPTPLVFALGAFVVAAVLAVSVVGCDSANPVAPTGTMLSVSASPTKIGLNGTSEITVIGRRPDGSALFPGTEISLATSLGSIDPLVEVGQGGVARATLRADGRSGTATVAASTSGAAAGGEGGATMSTVEVQIGETDTTRPTLLISVNPNQIPTEGQATVTVIARGNDGTPLGAGEEVLLTTTLGSLSPSRPQTGPDGVAESTLTAGTQAGEATITAILGASEAATTNLTIRDVPSTITLSANPTSVSSSNPPDVTLTAVVTNAQGDPIPGVSVTFSPDAGTLSSSVVQTNPQGIATTTLMLTEDAIESDDGDFLIRASVPSSAQPDGTLEAEPLVLGIE